VNAAEDERERNMGRYINCGFEKAERLQGDVGYVELRGFFNPAIGGDTAAAAMSFVADAEALIVDLRRNHGAFPEMVSLVASYLLEGEPVHLNDLHFRRGDRTQQFWTLPFVWGKHFGQKKPVCVLTSSETFSGGEESPTICRL
jgi:C-terminal processing protease CtpA/Prc